ncbi:MAG: polyphosphate kinase 1 [Kiritimatiellia bacterium]
MASGTKYFNRELSWLEFNQRVLHEAYDLNNPVFERLKFLAITASNLDEFFMVRVGGLHSAYKAGRRKKDISGLTPCRQLQLLKARARVMNEAQYHCFNDIIMPELAESGIRRIRMEELKNPQRSFLSAFFSNELYPCVTPMCITPAKQLPLIHSLSLYCAVRIQDSGSEKFTLIPMPRSIQRIIELPSENGYEYALLEDVIGKYINDWFPGQKVHECITFRITRNADMAVQEDEAPDLLRGMEEILEERKTSDCIRLEIESRASRKIVRLIQGVLSVGNDQTYLQNGPIDLKAFMQIASVNAFDELRVEPWIPSPSPKIDSRKSLFHQINNNDILLHHPYESFDPIIRFIEEAAGDPDVIAIKQVLYRTSEHSPIVNALKKAAARGKSVTVLIELKARFDEAHNIEEANELEQAGVQVIYGVKGFKTHTKICLAVRRTAHGIVRYAHFGTGNYNDATAKLYSDIGLLTCNEDLCSDAAAFFNIIGAHTQPQPLRKAVMAPIQLRNRLIELIDLEINLNKKGGRGHIIAKMNSLLDRILIDKLYEASRAGVRIQLNVRGICCLVPGVRGLSENITVTSIVDRYLEHARIFYFRHGGEKRVFISSADWMPRNLNGRFELMVPVETPECRDRLIDILKTSIKDTVKSWKLNSDGSYTACRKSGKNAVRSQEIFYRNACRASDKAGEMRRTQFKPHRPEK